MKQIRLSLITFVSAIISMITATLGAQESTPQKPNIVYILADDMGYADAGFTGSTEIKTPVLDKIASQGTILESFYTQSVCSPTRAALMSGRYPVSTGAYGVVKPNAPTGLPLNERTLAQALKDAGYETAIVGKWHLGESEPGFLPTNRGFDHQYGTHLGAGDYYTHQRLGVDDWYRNDKPLKEEGYTTTLIGNESCRLLKNRDASKPFFLYLSFSAPHDPYQVPDAYKRPYKDLPETRGIYAGMIAAMDEAIGQVYETLVQEGMLENTLIIFSSDNGGPKAGTVTSNLPFRGKKAMLFEGGVRVCAFASWPGHIPSGQTINEPFHIIDWYPTLVKLAGGSLDQALPLDGQDVWPVLTKRAKSPHEAILLCAGKPGTAALRMGDWKLTPSHKGIKLYNLANDLGETTNLAASNPEKLKEMNDKLKSMMHNAKPQAGREMDAGKKRGKK